MCSPVSKKKSILRLTDRASAMLTSRRESGTSAFVFANREGHPYVGMSLNHPHRDVCAPKVEGKRRPIFPADFVLHSLRHTMLTRLGGSRCFHHHADCRTQEHRRTATVYPSDTRGRGARFRAAASSGKGPEVEPKRQLPATVSATLSQPLSVSH